MKAWILRKQGRLIQTSFFVPDIISLPGRFFLENGAGAVATIFIDWPGLAPYNTSSFWKVAGPVLRPWKLQIRLEADSVHPIYLQLAHAIIKEIRRGRLTPGTAMPGTRVIAETVGINRKTVQICYDELVAQGWLIAKSTTGTFVSPDLPSEIRVRFDPSLSKPKSNFESVTFNARSSTLDIPSVSQTHDVLVFDDGTPDLRLVPIDIVARAYRRALTRASRRTEFGYGDPRGIFSLRQSISTMLNIERGLATTPNNICLTRGSQMAIYISAQLLVKAGDVVLLEELCYPPARLAFQQAGAVVIPIKIDQKGIQVDEIEKICRKTSVRAVYLTPHHHFPTTVSLTPDRRIRMISLAERYNFTIVEDDYDHEFHFSHQPLLPLASEGRHNTIYIGSLSKLLSPGFRIGYIAAPANFVDAVAAEVMLIDRQGNPASELAAAELIDEGEVRRHARKAKAKYLERRDVFAKILRDAFGTKLRFRLPDGGLALWVDFDKQVDMTALEEKAKEQRVQFLSSRSYSVAGNNVSGLRLGFASLEPRELREAVYRFYSACRATLGK